MDHGAGSDANSEIARRVTLAGHAFAWLTATRQVESADVRQLLLSTMSESYFLLSLDLFWVQTTAVAALFLSHAVWPIVWSIANAVLFACRIWLKHKNARADAEHARHPWEAILAAEAAAFSAMCFASMGALIINDPRMLVLGTVMMVGCGGYVASRWAAFPRFATILIYLAVAALTAGLVLSRVPNLTPIGYFVPVIAFAYQTIMLKNHAIMVTALRAQCENRRLSLHDALTGLPNRLMLRERLDRLCRAIPSGDSFAVLCLDLDGFKLVNDRYGHTVGDLLLQQVAIRLRSAVRQDDSVIRVGGDEFVVLLPAADADAAIDVAQRIVSAVSIAYEFGVADGVLVGVSVGIALSSAHGTQADQIVARADAALYEAKRSGKGVWRLQPEVVSV